MLLDQRLAPFHQLFSWASVGFSNCPINRQIGSHGHLNVWAFSWVQHDISRGYFKANSFEMKPLKVKFNLAFEKASLLFQNISQSEATSLLLTVQLNFNWNIKCPLDNKGSKQLFLLSNYFINPTAWYLVFGQNFVTRFLTIACDKGKTPSRTPLRNWKNVRRKNLYIFVSSMIMRQPLNCCCGQIISSIRPFDILSSV